MAKRDRRTDIMHAAEKLFTSRRYHEISLDDIVQEAKVGKGTVYRYFRDKDDLFFQTATSGFDELCLLLHKEVPGDASFTEQLVSACRHISGFFQRRRQLFRMMQSEDARMHWRRGEVRRSWMAHHKDLVSALSEILRKGVAEGHLRRDVPPDVLATFLLGMLRARTHGDWHLYGASSRAEGAGPLPDGHSFEFVVDLFVHGAAANGVPDTQETHHDTRVS